MIVGNAKMINVDCTFKIVKVWAEKEVAAQNPGQYGRTFYYGAKQ